MKYISLSDFDYELPAARIAEFPLPRGEAKQLRYEKGEISHKQFKELPEALKPEHLLFFNNTRVIPARMHFFKETGAMIEVFLLAPLKPSKVVAEAMQVSGEAVWEATIGNLKKWKDGQQLSLEAALDGEKLSIYADLVSREQKQVRLSWTPAHYSLAEVVEAAGRIPLPPYILREAEESDKETYQTVYSQHAGAVAAPTAGLHFSPEILQALADKGVEQQQLTLHVGAGTFQPVKSENALAHKMHGEQVVVEKQHLQALTQKKPVIAVGTTSMRTLESLYWFGVKVWREKPRQALPFQVAQFEPYQEESQGEPPPLHQVAQALLDYMERTGVEELHGNTEIYLFPGYQFRVCQGLVTNFHMPKSTLLLLIAAFIGNDWKKVYQEALDHGYRFLSYGDSSLLITPQQIQK